MNSYFFNTCMNQLRPINIHLMYIVLCMVVFPKGNDHEGRLGHFKNTWKRGSAYSKKPCLSIAFTRPGSDNPPGPTKRTYTHTIHTSLPFSLILSLLLLLLSLTKIWKSSTSHFLSRSFILILIFQEPSLSLCDDCFFCHGFFFTSIISCE